MKLQTNNNANNANTCTHAEGNTKDTALLNLVVIDSICLSAEFRLGFGLALEILHAR